eukprot:gene36688-59836_t
MPRACRDRAVRDWETRRHAQFSSDHRSRRRHGTRTHAYRGTFSS